eukprot:GHVH01011520.1.p1 GENE.GHVH01011520.1~~GHVH01011520.1.p1  ORF type:complete len:234 (+),score=37.67 GHVH01011520.1:30-731(+)
MFDQDGGFNFNAWNSGDDQQVIASNGPKPPIKREGDWLCSCGNTNFMRRNVCNKCGKKPHSAHEKNRRFSDGTTSQAKNKPDFTDDWICASCMNHNWARRDTCNICNTPKPAKDETPRLGKGGGHCDIQDPSDRLEHDSDDEQYDEYGRKKTGKSGRKILPQQLKKMTIELNEPQSHKEQHKLEQALRFPPAPADACVPWSFKEQILEEEAARVMRLKLKEEEEGKKKRMEDN